MGDYTLEGRLILSVGPGHQHWREMPDLHPLAAALPSQGPNLRGGGIYIQMRAGSWWGPCVDASWSPPAVVSCVYARVFRSKLGVDF